MPNRLYFISTASNDTSTAHAYDFSGVRQSADDILLGAGFWQGGLASDTRIYFVNNGTNMAVAYDFDGNRQAFSDISLGSSSWQAAVASDTRLYFVSDSGDAAIAYDFDGNRQTSDDISLGGGGWNATARSDDTLYFVNGTTEIAVAYDFDGNRLPTSNDISLGSGNFRGGLRSDTRIYFVSGSQAQAYDYSGTRQSSDDIELGGGRWQGGATTFDDGTPDALTFGAGTIADQAWVVGTAVNLTLPEATDGTGTITYSLSPTTPAGVTFTPGTRILAGNPTGRFTSATFTYTATDGNSDTVTLTFTIVVTAVIAFTPATIADQSFEIGDTANLTLPEATGVGDIAYSLSPALPGGLTFNAVARTITGTAAASFTSAEFTYTATDAELVTGTLTFDMAVTQPLRLDGTIANQMIGVGDAFSLRLPEGTGGSGTYTYTLAGTLPTGLTFDATTRVLAGTVSTTFPSMQFTYTVNDGTDTISLAFNIAVVADPIVFSPTNIADQSFDVGDTVNLTLPTATGGTGSIAYALVPALPGGLTFNAVARTITGTAAASFTSAEFTYTATDAELVTGTLTFDMAVTQPLQLDGTIANQMIGVGDAFSLRLPEGTGGSGTYTYTLAGTLPAGLTFDATTRVLAGSVASSFASMQFTYTVNDGTDTISLNFNIAVVADPIVFSPTNIADQIWRVGTSANVTLPVASGGIGALTLALTPALPAGMTFEAASRTITGTPTTVTAEATYTYAATDTESTSAELEFEITVEAMITMAGAVDFRTDTIADQRYVVGTAVNVQVPTATGGMGALMYGFSPALPDGLTFNAVARTITGTPTAAQPDRTYRYFASEDIDLVIDGDGNEASDFDSDEITDDTSTDFIEFQLGVRGELSFIGTVRHQLWVTNTTIDVTLPQAVGGTGTIAYTLAPAGLPVGIVLADRVLGGIPTTPVMRVLYTWTATDGTNTVVVTFNITVGNPIVFVPNNIPAQNYEIGQVVNTTLPVATDGTMGTITLSISPGLPTGLDFDSLLRSIAGTPREIISGKLFRYHARNAVTQAFIEFRVYIKSTAYTAANIDFQTLLPPNATEWELSVEETLRENFLPVDTNQHITMPVVDGWNPSLLPTHLLPYLGLNLSIEVDSALPETEQRNLLRASYSIHSIEGTPQSLLNIIFALGFDGAVIREGVEDPADSTTHWAHYSIEINQSITVIEAQRMIDLVKDVAPARCKLVSVDIAAGTETYDGTTTYDGTHTYGQISELSGLML